MAPDGLLRTLEDEADPDDAAVLARFFKTGPGEYGEGDIFIGIKLSRLRTLVQPYGRRTFHAADWLPYLQSPVHEHRLAALVIMADRANRGPAAELDEIYQTYLANTASVNNWDLVDASAAQIVGRRLLDRDRAPLDALARSGWLWNRRIAIVSTHAFIRVGQSADTYRIAELLLADDHDLIHKAVGWMLREAGKRVDRAELRAFLDAHASVMPRTMLSYATEHLAPDVRAHYRGLR